MAKFLGQYSSNYSNVYREDNKYEEKKGEPETSENKIYSAFNEITKKEVCLKVNSKQKLQDGDYDFLSEQLKREEELTKLCSLPYIVNFYQRLETDKNIIFELEQCQTDLSNYLFENGELCNEKTLFKEIGYKSC